MSSPQAKKALPKIRSSTEFARYVGLARTTVSRVLNGQPGLKQKTIERVRRAIEETGFVPNAYALHLKGKRTCTVGVCMENLLTGPAVEKLAMLQRALREHNLASLIEVSEPGSDAKVIRHFLSMRVDAVVFIGHFDEEQLARLVVELNAHGTPHLLIDHVGIKGATTVALDRARGMSAVMRHLLDLGHRSFGMLAFSSPVRSVRDRLRGVRDALAEQGLAFEQCTVSLDELLPRSNDFDFGRQIAQAYVERGRDAVPTAFVALNDEVAIGAMHGLKEAGFRVPQDVSVTGFNNQAICLMPTPSLTSVDQRIEETVEMAVQVLVPQLGQPPRVRPVVRMIDPLLVVRQSTGPARG